LRQRRCGQGATDEGTNQYAFQHDATFRSSRETASVQRHEAGAKEWPSGIEAQRRQGSHGLNCRRKMKVATSAAQKMNRSWLRLYVSLIPDWR
jgi:hypothetical protein